ncbi:MAG TPA: hypothetical protein VF370_04345, partial [Candidatus Cryosericum sp.]
RPADEDGRDHIPVFLGNVVEEIKAVTQRGIGEIFEAISMNLQASAGGRRRSGQEQQRYCQRLRWSSRRSQEEGR